MKIVMPGVHSVRCPDQDCWFYVYGTKVMGEELAAFMNGGGKPDWLHDMRAVSRSHAEADNGTAIVAVAKRKALRYELFDKLRFVGSGCR
jgi:hypothetical protein